MFDFSADFLTPGAAVSHAIFAVMLCAFSAVLTRWVIRWNIADVPNARSSHAQPTPKSGGVAIAISFLAGMVVILSVHEEAPVPDVPFAIFLAMIGVTFAAALADDLIELAPFIKLFCQLAAALVFSLFVARIDGLAVPMIGNLTFGWFGHLVTIGWFVLFMNVYNFMDGLDGLAAGGALIALFMLGGIGLILGAHVVYLSALCLFAAVAGFFAFNFPPAKIFMGDTGSQVIGFVIAGLAVIGARGDVGQISIVVVPALFSCFIVDVAATLLYRFFRKQPLTQAHREHLFQICNRLGFSHLRLSLIYYGLFLVSGAGAVLLQFADAAARLPLFISGLLVYVPLAVMVYLAGMARGVVTLTATPQQDQP